MNKTEKIEWMPLSGANLSIKKLNDTDKVIALAGNPNVGKSTVFNNLTGLNQHTGNWPGKTVNNAWGYSSFNEKNYIMVDIPGTYSLLAKSADEEAARNYICFGDTDAVIVVCDATCLERNLNLVLQILEIKENVVVCVNLMDEAEKKNIKIDLEKLSLLLGVPVVATKARSGVGLKELLSQVEEVVYNKKDLKALSVEYPHYIEEYIKLTEPLIKEKVLNKINSRWLSIRLLNYDENLILTLNKFLGFNLVYDLEANGSVLMSGKYLESKGITKKDFEDDVTSALVLRAEEIANACVEYDRLSYNRLDRKIDKYLTNKWTGFPIMILLFALIFWITITGANYPSTWISNGLFWIENRMIDFAIWASIPEVIYSIFIYGVYRVAAWVVSVMLPPMAIFFPLFTILEDLGYLPRIAFNLDKYFKKCHACGKQALTMCMGIGCNAVGVIGCRIIDSPRERLIAIITNNFIPCNGRFPTLISIITMFFVAYSVGPLKSISLALFLTGFIVFGVLITLIISKILASTILKGYPSSFILELPSYRRPQIGKVIIRSIRDRTLFVLGRAVVVAAPAGLVIWLLANISIENVTLLTHVSGFLDPFGRLMGLDGVILLSFILGFPANEIVIPIMIMTYMSTGSLIELESIHSLKVLLLDNGWTSITAICMMMFSIMHWPCSTTCLTIKKETKSIKWTVISFLVPTITGIIICMLISFVARIFIY